MDHDFENIRRGIEKLDLTGVEVSEEAILVVPARVAHRYHVLPVWYQEGILTLAIGEIDLDLMDHLVHSLSVEAIEFRLASAELIETLISRHYRDPDQSVGR